MRRYGESEAHERQKERVGRIIAAKGWEVYVDCKEFKCETAKGERTYWPDIYAQNYCSLDTRRANTDRLYGSSAGGKSLQADGRRIIVEIQGKGGHNTKLAFNSDKLRVQDIRQSHGGDIAYKDLQCRNTKSPLDIRNWTDEEIAEELGIS